MHTSRKPESLWKDLGALPASFWVLFAGTLINRFGSFVWPFLTIYLTRKGYSLAAASLALSAVGGGALLGGVCGGWLSDHFGRRNTIVLGTFGAASCVMLLYMAQSLPAIVLAAALLGVCSGAYHPAATALLVDLVPEEQRTRAFAALRLAANAGFAFGTAAGGVLVNHSLFWLFAGDALTTACYGGIAFFWLPHGLRRQTGKAPWRTALQRLACDRAFHSLWIAAFGAACVAMQFASTYSLHVIQRGASFHMGGTAFGPETVYGLLIGWNGALVVLAELPLTAWTLRFNPRHVMAVGYLFEGVGFALNGAAHTVLDLWLVMTFFTIGEMISAPTASAFVARLAPENLRGRYMGAFALAWNSAGILGPLAGFRLFACDPRALWGACAAFGVCVSVFLIRAELNFSVEEKGRRDGLE